LMAASWPSNREAAVTIRTLWVGVYLTGGSYWTIGKGSGVGSESGWIIGAKFGEVKLVWGLGARNVCAVSLGVEPRTS